MNQSRQGAIELVQLRAWVHRLALDLERASIRHTNLKREKKTIKLLERAVDGKPRGARRYVRTLLAAGVMRYKELQAPVENETLPDAIVFDFAADALWPLIHAPHPPNGWMAALSEIASPAISILSLDARKDLKTFGRVDRAEFQAQLADRRCAAGVLNMLRDLGDPRGTAPHLAALCLAGGVEAPDREENESPPKSTLRWILAGAAGAVASGVVGNRTDWAVVWVYEWLKDEAVAEHNTTEAGYLFLTYVEGDAHRGRAGGTGVLAGIFEALSWT
ncbi:hypothetical protein [Actinomycetospora flava]|uniref:Uncharacterized protein n=1 Tax=Actinomycetospora flava TaxID=3129232 RepID=A0ABU8MEY2_9PSEU